MIGGVGLGQGAGTLLCDDSSHRHAAVTDIRNATDASANRWYARGPPWLVVKQRLKSNRTGILHDTPEKE